MGWKPPLKPEEIPTPKSEIFAQMGAPCTLSASGEHWKSAAETGGVDPGPWHFWFEGERIVWKREEKHEPGADNGPGHSIE